MSSKSNWRKIDVSMPCRRRSFSQIPAGHTNINFLKQFFLNNFFNHVPDLNCLKGGSQLVIYSQDLSILLRKTSEKGRGQREQLKHLMFPRRLLQLWYNIVYENGGRSLLLIKMWWYSEWCIVKRWTLKFHHHAILIPESLIHLNFFQVDLSRV